DEPSIEHRDLHPLAITRPREADASRLKAWAQSETGLPFLDACLRYLRATGWLNFRMRAMVTSVASYHLWLDWRASGSHLARMFTDYEPGIHWPQVQMQSGTTGINTPRIYNPVKQGLDQDPTGAFTRAWLPELATVPDAFLHEPWKWPGAGSLLGRRYPEPIIDLASAAREARELIWRARKATGFADTAAKIVHRHASRANVRLVKGRPPRRTVVQTQLTLDL
ncbi:FAD-binding domain-containing protein, partial [Tabrizicola sp.]|uniref:FAD-binding domain-containing protein n=1 Tax=Tabrizicola sp. TaxID=2005166 RepID=UPI003F33C857